MNRRLRKAAPVKVDLGYASLWRIVDGAVRDAYQMHPDYLSNKGASTSARISVVKRVVGALMGLEEAPPRGDVA